MSKPRTVIEPQRITLTRTEAAAACGVSPTFFDERIRPELACIRRGSQVLWAVDELERWATESSETPLERAA